MIHTLIALLVLFVILGLVFYVLHTLPLPAPWGVVVQVLAVLVVILMLVDLLYGGSVTGLSLRTR